jgi:hypothetical protein
MALSQLYLGRSQLRNDLFRRVSLPAHPHSPSEHHDSTWTRFRESGHLSPAPRQACRHNDLEVELRDWKQLFERLGHFDAIASAEPQPEAGRSA